MSGFFKTTEKGVLLFIHLTPNAAKDEFLGIIEFHGKTCLKAKIRAVPEKGKANSALCKFIAKSLGLPKSRLEVISGHTSRLKTILVCGDGNKIKGKLKVLGNG